MLLRIMQQLKQKLAKFPKLEKFIVIVMAMVAVCLNILMPIDVHADDLTSQSTITIVLDNADHNHQQDNNDGGCTACAHVGCHHAHTYMNDGIISREPTRLMLEIINGIYNSPPDFNLSERLLKPPRH